MAANAREQLEFISDVRARRARGAVPATALAVRQGAPGTAEPDPSGGTAAPPESIHFLKGTLLGVTCQADSPGAVLHVQAGGRMWTMLMPDRAQTVIIGADGLDCGWKQKKVAVNYRKKGDAGEVVSLEISRD